jgi:hypothetical protein
VLAILRAAPARPVLERIERDGKERAGVREAAAKAATAIASAPAATPAVRPAAAAPALPPLARATARPPEAEVAVVRDQPIEEERGPAAPPPEVQALLMEYLDKSEPAPQPVATPPPVNVGRSSTLAAVRLKRVQARERKPEPE